MTQVEFYRDCLMGYAAWLYNQPMNPKKEDYTAYTSAKKSAEKEWKSTGSIESFRDMIILEKAIQKIKDTL